MEQYSNLVSDILLNGAESDDRTGVGTLSVFGAFMKFDIREEFPLLTLKRTYWAGVIAELMWMLSGSTNAYDLPINVQKWWTPWADDDGELGPTYGKQFRNSGGVDQLKNLVQGLRDDPNSRRHNIALWNPSEISHMNLPPCHGNLVQFYVRDGELSCHMYQRSADMFLGVPVNIAFYSLLTHLVAKEVGLKPGEYSHSIGDAHIYSNHVEQCKEMVAREMRPLPTLSIGDFPGGSLFTFIDTEYKKMSIGDVRSEVIILENYKPSPTISGEVAI